MKKKRIKCVLLLTQNKNRSWSFTIIKSIHHLIVWWWSLQTILTILGLKHCRKKNSRIFHLFCNIFLTINSKISTMEWSFIKSFQSKRNKVFNKKNEPIFNKDKLLLVIPCIEWVRISFTHPCRKIQCKKIIKSFQRNEQLHECRLLLINIFLIFGLLYYTHTNVLSFSKDKICYHINMQ